MEGIDVSSWQSDIDLAKVQCDFVICKATGGTGYTNPFFRKQIDQAISLNKLVGAYHFARDGYTDTTPEAEAKYFINTVRPYIGKGILALDWEAEAAELGATWAKRWLDYVFDVTGVRPFIYGSYYTMKSPEWENVAAAYPLWLAHYGIASGADIKVGKWDNDIAIHQYTSDGLLSGYEQRLDLNASRLDANDWMMYACGDVEPVSPVGTAKQAFVDVFSIAQEVIDGKWGNGAERKKRLGSYFYDLVQREVNRLMGV